LLQNKTLQTFKLLEEKKLSHRLQHHPQYCPYSMLHARTAVHMLVISLFAASPEYDQRY